MAHTAGAAPPPLGDPCFFSVLQALDDYLAAQEQLQAHLKGGLLELARARYALGPASLGQAQYPGAMQASALVARPSCASAAADSSRSGQDLQQQQQQPFEQFQLQQQDACLQQPASKHGQPGDGSVTVDPISWFCALPPAPLKAAQRSFGEALEAVVAAANALQRLRQQATAGGGELARDAGEEADAAASGGSEAGC
jgi:hypothetical protein